MCGFPASWAPMVAERTIWLVVPLQKGHSVHCVVSLLQGLPTHIPERIWTIKLSWTATQCYRRAFSVMCFRKSVLLRGRVLVGKGLQSLFCCQAVRMRMTGSISCYRKRTYGLPLQPGVQRGIQGTSGQQLEEGCHWKPLFKAAVEQQHSEKLLLRSSRNRSSAKSGAGCRQASDDVAWVGKCPL